MSVGGPGPATVLVVAKAPAPGRVKTRLAADIGDDGAARVAAAALLDTLEACAAAVGPGRCRLAVAGDLESAVHADLLRSALAGWSVVPQTHGGLGERIAAACAATGTPVLQIGMDTPQVSADVLRSTADALADHDAVLGSAEDGGWWLLGLRDPADAAAIVSVPMSTPRTGELTRQALAGVGLDVADAPALRDIDDVTDLRAVAELAPYSRTATIAAEVLR
jgi:rSAM/selenodomain-associated transferase 1